MSERHPIEPGKHIPLEDRVMYLEQMLASLWDQVWWMNLPKEKQDQYKAEGFKDPIEHFYIEE